MRNLVPVLLLLPCTLFAATPVTTAPLAELLIYPERSAPAEVVALNEADLSAEITARVIELPVRVGQVVDTGALLVRLDCRDYLSRRTAEQASLLRLQAQRQQAVNQLARARDLKKERNISQEEVERRDTDLQSLDAQIAAQQESLDQAELNVERCEVNAPFHAVVSRRLTSVGTLATPGTPLVNLVQLDDSEVSARLRPSEVEQGARAERVEFEYVGRSYRLAVSRVSPVVDPRTRTVEIRLSFQDAAAPPGASGRLRWRAATAHLPADLLVRRDGRLGIFLLDGDTARFHALPEALEGQPTPVDLPGTTPIVLEGRQRLNDGESVVVTPRG